jgi:DNA polymerase-3 subunit beta
MELKLRRNDVLQELSILQGVVEHRTTIPILSSLLTETTDGRLNMVATDLDMTIITSCAAKVDGGGRLTLESKVFQELVRNLPEEEFTIRQEGDAVEIISGRFRSKMAVADPAEYPTLPDIPPIAGYPTGG